MTGRAAGYCAGYPVAGFMNPYGGRWPGRAYAPSGAIYGAGMPGAYPQYAPFAGRGLGLAWGRGGGLAWGRGGGWGMGMGWGCGWGRGGGFGRGRGRAW
jgi:hypothetical protein